MAIAEISAGLTLLKKVKDLLPKSGASKELEQTITELRGVILSLQGDLSAAEQAKLALVREREELERRIAELEESLRDKRRLNFRDNALWDETTGEVFCSPCFEDKRR